MINNYFIFLFLCLNFNFICWSTQEVWTVLWRSLKKNHRKLTNGNQKKPEKMFKSLSHGRTLSRNKFLEISSNSSAEAQQSFFFTHSLCEEVLSIKPGRWRAEYEFQEPNMRPTIRNRTLFVLFFFFFVWWKEMFWSLVS